MSNGSIVNLARRRKALRRKLRRLAGSAAAYLASAPADEGQPHGVVLPFRKRAEPLLGRFSQFEQLAASARGEDAAPDASTPLEIRWDGAAAESASGVLTRLSMRWTRPDAPVRDSTYIRPVLTVVPGGRADRDLGV